MITKFNSFQEINENKYTEIKNKYNSLGEYVEHLYNIIDDKEEFSRILGDYLKVDKKKYNSKTFKEGDYVLIEYWYKDILTPVKIVEKKGRTYTIDHNIEGSDIRNAPKEKITRDRIVDHYKETHDSKLQKPIDSSIRISKAVNVLNSYDQMMLVKRLQDDFQIDEKVKFELEEIKDMSLLGKTGFNSFIKVVTALSLPNIESDRENCPKDFFIIFLTEVLNKERLLKVFKRFRSMNQISDLVSKYDEQIRIYFGLKYNQSLYLEYGIVKGDNRVIVGEYKLTKKNYQNLKEMNSKPLKSLQKQIENIDINDLKKLMRIKGDLSNFSPGYFHEKSNPYIEDNMLHQGYYGTGKWDKGTITSNSFNEIKENFKKWVIEQKWKKEVSFNIKPEKFWIWVKIKLK
jgi:hypothetical protein